MNKDKRAFFILLVGLFALLNYSHLLLKEIAQRSYGGDFSHYWLMASLLKEGQDIWKWDQHIQERSMEISKKEDITLVAKPLHSLGFFLFVLPFSLFHFRSASFLWLVLGHLCLFYAVWLIIKICKEKSSLEDLSIVLFLVFSFWPIREQLHSEQPSFFILFFLTVSLFLMKKGQMLWAGIFLSLAVQFREYLAMMVLFFLWKRNWRLLAGLILGFLILKTTAIFVFGWARELSYWKYMVLMFNGQTDFDMLKLSISAVIYRIGKDWVGLKACTLISLLCTVFFIGKAFSWVKKNEVDLESGFSLFLILAFLVSPWVHEQHYVALYPAMIIIWFGVEKEKDPILYGLFASAYLLLGVGYSLISFPRFHSGLLAIFTGGKLLGVIVLFFLTGRLIQQRNYATKDLKE